jgi:hypothetical protein
MAKFFRCKYPSAKKWFYGMWPVGVENSFFRADVNMEDNKSDYSKFETNMDHMRYLVKTDCFSKFDDLIRHKFCLGDLTPQKKQQLL